jgi:hypothetical protein
MKKALLSLLLLAGLHGTTHAQNGNLALGVKAGGTLSSFVGAGAKSDRYTFGYHAGVLANLSLSNHIAFQPELLYSQKGASVELDGSSDNRTYRLHYVDVPLAFHVNAGGLFFEAGPQVGFLAGAYSKVGSTSTDIKNNYNVMDFGYLAGLGYQRKRGLGAGLRYNGGFTNVEKATTTGSTTEQIQARNSAFQLYLTYSFNAR